MLLYDSCFADFFYADVFWFRFWMLIPSFCFSISEAVAVTFDVQNCNLAGLLPPFLHPGGPFGALETPWEAMGVAARTRGGSNSSFS